MYKLGQGETHIFQNAFLFEKKAKLSAFNILSMLKSLNITKEKVKTRIG